MQPPEPFYQPDKPKETHRRHLPHWQQGDVWCFATWRLGDSLPAGKLKQWQQEKDLWRKFHPEPWDEAVECEYHVHVLFQPLHGHRIEAIVQSWKGYSARMINRRSGITGALWQDEYWDRLIRNGKHLHKCAEYVRENPEKARLRPGEFVLWEREDGVSLEGDGLSKKEDGLSSPS